jgi:hypothetical protein
VAVSFHESVVLSFKDASVFKLAGSGVSGAGGALGW